MSTRLLKWQENSGAALLTAVVAGVSMIMVGFQAWCARMPQQQIHVSNTTKYFADEVDPVETLDPMKLQVEAVELARASIRRKEDGESHTPDGATSQGEKQSSATPTGEHEDHSAIDSAASTSSSDTSGAASSPCMWSRIARSTGISSALVREWRTSTATRAARRPKSGCMEP